MLRIAFVLFCIVSAGHGRRFLTSAEKQALLSLASTPATAFNPSSAAPRLPSYNPVFAGLRSADMNRLNHFGHRVPELSMTDNPEPRPQQDMISRRGAVATLLTALAVAAAPSPVSANRFRAANADKMEAMAEALQRIRPQEELDQERKEAREREAARQRLYDKRDRAEELAAAKSGSKPFYCSGMMATNSPQYVNMCDIVGPSKADQANTEYDSFGNANVGAYTERLMAERAAQEKATAAKSAKVKALLEKSR